MTSVEARFHHKKGSFTLDVELALPGSGVTCLFGPSGSGKTTLLRLVAGLERPQRGELCVNGSVWHSEKMGVFMPAWRRPTGYVFQDSRLFPHLTVEQNLLYAQARSRNGERSVGLDDVAEWLSLKPLLGRYPAQLSGGQKQKVAIGRAALSGPKILLMDEPLASLDEQSKSEILRRIERLCKEVLSVPVLYVSHSVPEVARLADHIAVINEGRVGFSGPIHEMMTDLRAPLAMTSEAGSVIDATVSRHEDPFGLTYLEFPGGVIAVANDKKLLRVGERARVRIIASDVSLALERPGRTSILNIFEARVAGMADKGEAQTQVKLDIGGVCLLASVTRKSAANLDLGVGKKVFAQVKTAALVT